MARKTDPRKKKTTLNRVALWLGAAQSDAVLEKALKIEHDRNGESRGSEFGRAFFLRYEDGLREAERIAKPVSIEKLLEGISYWEQAIPALVSAGAQLRSGENCFICLYDFDPQKGGPESWTRRGLALRFVACVEFERPLSKWEI